MPLRNRRNVQESDTAAEGDGERRGSHAAAEQTECARKRYRRGTDGEQRGRDMNLAEMTW